MTKYSVTVTAIKPKSYCGTQILTMKQKFNIHKYEQKCLDVTLKKNVEPEILHIHPTFTKREKVKILSTKAGFSAPIHK